jgi:hypothetical protein
MYDALGQDPQRLFSRSQSQDNIAEQAYPPQARPKPRSSSYGQNGSGSTYPSSGPPVVASGSRRPSNESTRPRRESTRDNSHSHSRHNASSSIHFPSSHNDNIDGMPGESLLTTSRPKKLSTTSITSTAGHRTVGHQNGVTAREPRGTQQHQHQHQQHQAVLHPANTHSYHRIPSNEQLGPRSRKSSLQQQAVTAAAAAAANGSSSRPSTSAAGYPYPTTASIAQPVASPHVVITSMSSTPWASGSKPLPPKPEGGTGPGSLEQGSGIAFPEPHVPGQSQPLASTSATASASANPHSHNRASGLPMSANLIVDPNSIPREDITIHNHSHSQSHSRPHLSSTLTSRKSASGALNVNSNPNRSSLNISTNFTSRAQSPNSLHAHSAHQRSASGSGAGSQFTNGAGNGTTTNGRSGTPSSSHNRNADTVVYPRTYNEATMSDSATAAMSTRTPRLRRTSATRGVGSGPSSAGAQGPTNANMNASTDANTVLDIALEAEQHELAGTMR